MTENWCKVLSITEQFHFLLHHTIFITATSYFTDAGLNQRNILILVIRESKTYNTFGTFIDGRKRKEKRKKMKTMQAQDQ